MESRGLGWGKATFVDFICFACICVPSVCVCLSWFFPTSAIFPPKEGFFCALARFFPMRVPMASSKLCVYVCPCRTGYVYGVMLCV